jgi:hypothetical protein
MYLSAPLPRTIFQGALDGATNAITSTYPNIASPFFPDGGRFLVHPRPLDGLALQVFSLSSEPIEDEDNLATLTEVLALVVFSCSFSRVAQFKSISVGITGSRYTISPP